MLQGGMRNRRGNGLVLLALAFLLAIPALAHAANTTNSFCPVNPVPSYMDILLDPPVGPGSIVTALVYNISADDYIKNGLNGSIVFNINQTDKQHIKLCYEVTDEGGWANFTYDSGMDGCTDYWLVFCPQPNAITDLAQRETCLNGTKIPYALIYNNGQPIAKCDPGHPAPAINPANGDYYVAHNQFYVCTVRPKSYAGLCWPVMLIVALLVGAGFLMGKNPFMAYDFSAPRMNRGKQYVMRNQNRSLDFTSILMTGLDKAAETGAGIGGDSTKGKGLITGAITGTLMKGITAGAGALGVDLDKIIKTATAKAGNVSGAGSGKDGENKNAQDKDNKGGTVSLVPLATAGDGKGKQDAKGMLSSVTDVMGIINKRAEGGDKPSTGNAAGSETAGGPVNVSKTPPGGGGLNDIKGKQGGQFTTTDKAMLSQSGQLDILMLFGKGGVLTNLYNNISSGFSGVGDKRANAEPGTLTHSLFSQGPLTGTKAWGIVLEHMMAQITNFLSNFSSVFKKMFSLRERGKDENGKEKAGVGESIKDGAAMVGQMLLGVVQLYSLMNELNNNVRQFKQSYRYLAGSGMGRALGLKKMRNRDANKGIGFLDNIENRQMSGMRLFGRQMSVGEMIRILDDEKSPLAGPLQLFRPVVSEARDMLDAETKAPTELALQGVQLNVKVDGEEYAVLPGMRLFDSQGKEVMDDAKKGEIFEKTGASYQLATVQVSNETSYTYDLKNGKVFDQDKKEITGDKKKGILEKHFETIKVQNDDGSVSTYRYNIRQDKLTGADGKEITGDDKKRITQWAPASISTQFRDYSDTEVYNGKVSHYAIGPDGVAVKTNGVNYQTAKKMNLADEKLILRLKTYSATDKFGANYAGSSDYKEATLYYQITGSERVDGEGRKKVENFFAAAAQGKVATDEKGDNEQNRRYSSAFSALQDGYRDQGGNLGRIKEGMLSMGQGNLNKALEYDGLGRNLHASAFARMFSVDMKSNSSLESTFKSGKARADALIAKLEKGGSLNKYEARLVDKMGGVDGAKKVISNFKDIGISDMRQVQAGGGIGVGLSMQLSDLRINSLQQSITAMGSTGVLGQKDAKAHMRNEDTYMLALHAESESGKINADLMQNKEGGMMFHALSVFSQSKEKLETQKKELAEKAKKLDDDSQKLEADLKEEKKNREKNGVTKDGEKHVAAITERLDRISEDRQVISFQASMLETASSASEGQRGAFAEANSMVVNYRQQQAEEFKNYVNYLGSASQSGDDMTSIRAMSSAHITGISSAPQEGEKGAALQLALSKGQGISTAKSDLCAKRANAFAALQKTREAAGSDPESKKAVEVAESRYNNLSAVDNAYADKLGKGVVDKNLEAEHRANHDLFMTTYGSINTAMSRGDTDGARRMLAQSMDKGGGKGNLVNAYAAVEMKFDGGYFTNKEEVSNRTMELKLSQVEERINKYSYDQSPISKAFLQDNLNRLKEQNEYLNDLGGLEASSKEEAREKMEGKGLKASMFVDKAQYDAAISEAEYAVQKLEVQEARAYRSSGEGVQVAMNALQKNWFERNGLYGSSYLTNTYGDLLNEARGATESHMGSDLQSYTSLAGWRSSVDGYELMQEKFEFSKPELQSVSAAPKQIELPRVDAGEIPVPQKTIEIPRSFIAHLDTAGEGAVKSYSKNVADYVSKSELDKKVGKDEVVAIKIHVPYERANKVNQDFNEKLESTLVSSIKAELESRGIKNAVVEAGENPTMSFSKLAQRVDENNWQGIQKQFKAKGGVMAVNDDGKAKSISSDLKKGGFDYSQITKAPTLGAFQSALQEASTYHQEPIYLQKASNASVQSVYDPDRQVAVSVQKRGNEGRKK